MSVDLKDPKLGKKCIVCNKSLLYGVTVHRSSCSNNFYYLEPGESAHLECYIDLCVEKSLEKQIDHQHVNMKLE